MTARAPRSDRQHPARPWPEHRVDDRAVDDPRGLDAITLSQPPLTEAQQAQVGEQAVDMFLALYG